MSSSYSKDFKALGYCIIPDVLVADRCESLIATVEELSGDRPGIRLLLIEPWCREVAESIQQHADIDPLLPESAVAVQCTLFDKSPEKNWLVAWHQDLSIPVRERTDDSRCSGWSRKEGTWFVQPPDEVLRQLVAVRLQLDEPQVDDGALRVIPGSHERGKLSGEEIEQIRSKNGERVCQVSRGGALLMRPLLLHSSSKMEAGRRRVLHFLFGPPNLPCGLQWC